MTVPSPEPRYPVLQSPISIGGLRLPHRVLTGSMHTNMETSDPSALAAFYTERVAGGAALIVTGGAAVNRVGSGSADYALINEAEHQDRWRPIVEAVHDAGGRIALQLFHAGRYAFESSFGLRPVAPSAVYSRFSRCEPEAMSQEQIAETIADFASATAAARAIGFDAVEVMGSEGYLLNEFASPVTNLRDDEWGGDAQRRQAFPVAVVSAVRQEAGDLAVIVRSSGADLIPGSSTPEEADALAVAFAAAGADAIDVGIGWHESPVPTVQTLVPHGIWVDVAARVKRSLSAAGSRVPVIASNRINTAEQAERILSTREVDMVAMARPFLADSQILAKSFAGRESFVNTCIGCNEACIDLSLGTTPISCLVNPRAGRELEFPMVRTLRSPTETARASAPQAPTSGRSPRVAVIGAGPAGMEAARSLATNGAEVTLWDAAERIGGQFLMAGMVPGKADFLETVRFFENELSRLGVDVRLGATVDAVEVLGDVDHVVVATGVRPRHVDLPGVDLPHVIDYAEAFANPDAVAERVAVIGAGGIGVDLAHLLVEVRSGSRRGHPAPLSESERGRRFLSEYSLASEDVPAPARQVTIMRRSGSIGAGMGVSTRWAVVQTIRKAGVRTLTDVAYRRIETDGVWIEHDGAEQLIPADTVVIAAGQESHAGPAPLLEAADIPHTVIGGAIHSAGMNAVAAFEQGLRTGTALAAS